MAVTRLSPVYDNFLNFVVEKATPQEILTFQISDEARLRAADLLERSSAGTLTLEEAAELEQMQQLDRLVAALKAKALEAMALS
jgi:hypothetical protein